jgi:hypothetical protein
MARCLLCFVTPLLIQCGAAQDAVSPLAPPSAEATDVPLGEPFDISPTVRARVSGTDLRIALVTVEDDSRCPVDVQCVHAGDALVRLALRSTEHEEQRVLHAVGQPAETVFGRYRIALEDLEPAPVSGDDIEPGEYEATLRVTLAGER